MAIPEPIEVEMADWDSADLVRNQFPDCIRDDEDDRRTKTVTLSGDTPDFCLDEIIRIETLSYEQGEARFGQEPLSRREKMRLDFTRTNLFHAQACKAIASYHGVLEWMDYYDHSLTTDEHVDIYAREAGDPGTMRMMATEAW